MERLAINELLKWKNKLGYKRTALCGKWSRILFDIKLIFLMKTQKKSPKNLHKREKLLIQVSQVRELIEVKEVITPYGRSGSEETIVF